MLSRLWTTWRTNRTNKSPRAAASTRPTHSETRRLPQVEILEDRLAPAVSIIATMSDQAVAVSPGGTIDYKVVITNSGATDAAGVQYNDTVDPSALPST